MLRIFLLLLLATLAGHSAGSKSTLRFLAFPKIQDDSPVEIFLGKESQTIELFSHRLSAPITVTTQAQWGFGKTAVDEEGQPKREIWGSGKGSGTNKQIILLLRKGAKNSDGFHVISYPDGSGNFGAEEMLFLNLTSQDIAGDIGTVKFAIKPGKHSVISPKANIRKGLCHAKLFVKNEEEWRPFLSTNWPIKPNMRGLVFIYNEPGSKKVLLHTISDFL